MLASGTYGDEGLQKTLQQTMCWSGWIQLYGVLELCGKFVPLFNVIFDWDHIRACWRTEWKGTFKYPDNTSFLVCMQFKWKK